MSNQIQLPQSSQFSDWTEKDVFDAVEIVKDESKDPRIRLHFTKTLRKYVKELKEHYS